MQQIVLSRTGSFLDNSIVKTKRDVSVFTDYRSSNFSALVIELSTVVPTDGVAGLQSALAAYLKCTKLGADLSLQGAATLKDQVKAIDGASALLHTEIQRPCWRLGI